MRNISLKRRMLVCMGVASFILVLLIIRVGYLQFVSGRRVTNFSL